MKLVMLLMAVIAVVSAFLGGYTLAKLRYEVHISVPPGLTWNAATGILSGTPPKGSQGRYLFNFEQGCLELTYLPDSRR